MEENRPVWGWAGCLRIWALTSFVWIAGWSDLKRPIKWVLLNLKTI